MKHLGMMIGLLLLGVSLFAAGQTEEKNYQQVNGLKNWNQVLDLSQKKPGQYNLIIRSKDEAGNTAFAGPFNIIIDPLSDLPVPVINNPVNNQRVGGSLNIVGTCIDDDGVKLVEVRIDGGDWLPATGTEYWSIVIPKDRVPDGLHQIFVRATDINGVQSKEVKTAYHLDTLKPQNAMTSHDQGALVSGDVRLVGTILDANGIQKLQVSSDGGKSYRIIDFRYEDKQKQYIFDYSFDTRKLPDGPNVWWFKSEDKTKSIGLAPFLFFVDNTKPVIDFLKPLKDQKVQGRTHIVGRATDTVGVASVTYRWGKEEKIAVPLVPGDPIFSVYVDLPVTGYNTEVEFTIKDLAGNIVRYPFKASIDVNADVPVLDLRYPKDQSIIRSSDPSGLSLAGFLSDDDGPGAIVYSIDGAKEVAIPVGQSFRVVLPAISSGQHSIQVKPQDSTGAIGKPVQIRVTVVDKLPKIQITNVVAGTDKRDFVPGIAIRRDVRNQLSGVLWSSNGIQNLVMKYGNENKEVRLGVNRGQQAGSWQFVADIPPEIGYGVIPVSLIAEDAFQQKEQLDTFLYVVNYTTIHEEHGIRIPGSMLNQNGAIVLRKGSVVSAFLVGGDIASVQLDPPTTLVTAWGEGALLKFDAAGEGTTPETVVTVKTSNNHVFSTQKLVFVAEPARVASADDSPRVLVEEIVDQSGSAAFYAGIRIGDRNAVVNGQIETSAQIKNASIGIAGGQMQSLSIRQDNGKQRFSISLPQNLPFERVDLRFNILDNSGKTTDFSTFLYKVDKSWTQAIDDAPGLRFADTRLKPGNTLFLPSGETAQAFFNGRQLASVVFEPASDLADVTFSGSSIFMRAKKDGISPPLKLVATTIDGEVYTLPDMSLNTDGLPPQIMVDTPAVAAWLAKSLLLRLEIAENLGLKIAEYSFDDIADFKPLLVKAGKLGPIVPPQPSAIPKPSKVPAAVIPSPQPAPSAKPTVAPVITPKPTAPRASVAPTVKPAVAPVAKPSTAPVIKPSAKPVTSPRPGGQSPEVGTGSGGETVLNGSELAISHIDQTLDISGLAEGSHLLVVRVTDNSGNVAYAYVPFQNDYTPPELQFVTPPADSKVNGLITLTATATDNGAMQAFTWSTDGETFMAIEGVADLAHAFDLSKFEQLPEKFVYRVTDKSGNSKDFTAPIAVDSEADKPTVQLQLPLELDVMRQDFKVSGMAFDDDGVGTLYYRLDGAEWTKLSGASNFSIPYELAALEDNEHIIEVKAVDINGVEGNVQLRKFRVSREEPLATLVKPTIDVTSRGIITLEGTAFDKNGIKEVWVSFDNGNSFNLAEGKEVWSYTFNTAIVKDNTYAVQMKVFDNYDTEGLHASLLNFDNTAPRVSLDKPFDGEGLNGKMYLDGRVADNIALESVEYVLSRLSADLKPVEEILRKPIKTKGAYIEEVDVSALAPGWYNVRVEAMDKAKNYGFAAKNFQVMAQAVADRIDILYPLRGEDLTGMFKLEGQVTAKTKVEKVSVYIGDELLEEVAVNKRGFFSLLLGPGKLKGGAVALTIKTLIGGAGTLSSETRSFSYQQEGPWIILDDLTNGDYVRDRPYFKGKAGWHLWPLSDEDKKNEAVRKAREELLEQTKLSLVEISFDNGKTFTRVNGESEWKYRLESLEIPDGPLYILMRSTYRNGQSVVSRVTLTLDQTEPDITLLVPEEGGRFNDRVEIKGIASDNYALESVDVNLRDGDKAAYVVPGFIEGLYLDGHFLGATNWEVGLGLTFFDDNVKLQAQLGQTPPNQRFEGFVVGIKLLANVMKLPFQSFLGPDWEFLSTSLAVGAKFSYFSMSDSSIEFKENSPILGGILAHWEVVRFSYDSPVFSSFALYTEFELWMISSDVQAGFKPLISFGVSIDLL